MNEKDIVSLDYDLWIVESNELYDTTREETAKEHEVFDENKVYQPITTVVGIGRVIKGFDDSLLGAEVDKEYEVEIPPEQAYGARDSKLVEVHSLHEIRRLPEFKKKDVEPYVGMELIYKGKPAYISSMTASRVRIDFNHRLAGRTLKYKYKVIQKFEGEGRVKALVEADYGKSDDFKIEISGKEVTLVLPEICKYDQNWLVAKYRIVSDMREVVDIDTIRFVEEYAKKEEKKETGDKEAGKEKGEEKPEEPSDKETPEEPDKEE